MPIKPIPLDELIDKAGNLPPMPMVAQKALQIIQNPKSNMSDLANVIKLDQSMTSLILRWVNSGYYNLRSKMVSIEQAVSYLGQRTVQNLVLSASISSYMNRASPGYALEKGDLWKRSIGMAAGARLIAKDIQPDIAEDAFYAGMFCDVGKLAFDLLLQKYPINMKALGEHPFDEVEKLVFGYDHATVGAAIVKRWNFPEYMSEIIQNHHTPANVKPEYKILAYSVHAADAVMSMFGIGLGLDSMQYQLDPETVNILKWNDAHLEIFYNRVLPVVEEASSFLTGR
jgi:HD-like signal output (HDOD) protein